MSKPTHPLVRISVLVYVVAHALAVLSLLAFGLRADGWVLNPVAVIWHGLFTLGSLLLLVRTWSDAASPWLLIVPPMLMLTAVGAFPATAALGGATYAPYDPGDEQDLFLLLNALSALIITALSQLYRWPRLALAQAMAQGLLLITYPAWWVSLLRWGSLGVPAQVALVAAVLLLYVVAARSLGVPLLHGWRRWALIGLGVGIGLTILARLRQATYLRELGYPAGGMPDPALDFALEVPLFVAFGMLLAVWPRLVRQLLAAPADGRRFPSEALALIVPASVAVSILLLTPGQALPAAGTVQGWVSSSHVVPDAWLPAIFWAGWLFPIAVGLVFLHTLIELPNALRYARQRLARPAYPGVILWVGAGWLLAHVWNISPLGFPLRAVGETHPVAAESTFSLVGGVLLLLAGRALERRWSVWGGLFWRWLTLGGLLATLVWNAQMAWTYSRVIFAPLPAWADRWQYAPLSPILLASLGLALHVSMAGLSIVALAKTWRAWQEVVAWSRGPVVAWLLRSAALPLLLIAIPVGVWWSATTPAIARTVPADGAMDVPRDTVILVEMAPPKEWLARLLGGSGLGLRSHYADTGEYIPGMTTYAGTGFFFDPEELLRPNAPVEIIAYRTGERPYALRFTTAGADGPAATPLPGLQPSQ